MSITNTTSKYKQPEISSLHYLTLLDMTPETIYAQEKLGQQELVRSSQLPSNSGRNVNVIEQYEKMGIKVIGESIKDDLFLDVELPQGWSIKDTDHSMHSKLLDDKGRERAGIFYKAAFYDRTADITFYQRIRLGQ